MSFKIETLTQNGVLLESLRYIVGQAGGHWSGIQDSLLPDTLAKIMFINPETKHHLGVSFNPVDFDALQLMKIIRARMDEDNAEFAARRVSVLVATLQKISKDLSALTAEIDALLERKKS